MGWPDVPRLRRFATSVMAGLALAGLMAVLSLFLGSLLSLFWPAVDPLIERAVRFVSVHPTVIAAPVAFVVGFVWMWRTWGR